LRRVVDDIGENALACTVRCPICEGIGRRSLNDLTTCHHCEGTGKVTEPGRLESARLLFKVAGLLEPGVAISVTQNVNTVVVENLPTLEDVILANLVSGER